MSEEDIVKDFVSHSRAAFDDYYEEFATGFMEDFRHILKGSAKEAKDRLAKTLKRAGKLHLKELTTKDANLKRDYKRSAEESFEMAKLIMYGEAIAISNQTANALMAGFKAGVSGLAGAMKVSVRVAVSGAAKGLLASVIA